MGVSENAYKEENVIVVSWIASTINYPRLVRSLAHLSIANFGPLRNTFFGKVLADNTFGG